MTVTETRERGRLERRTGILRAAEKVFLQKGLPAATMEDIARESGLSKGALYLYFRSKDELYLTIAVYALGDIVKEFELAQLNGSSTGIDRLRSLMRAYARYATSKPDRFKLATTWIMSDVPVPTDSEAFQQYQALVSQVYDTAAAAVRVGQQDGTIRQDVDSAEVVIQIWGALLGVLSVRNNVSQVTQRVPFEIDANRMADRFVELVANGLQFGST
jgi:AcrR family transcriptional regulator